MREASHTIMGGKVFVYKRDNSRFWQCSTHFKNKNYRVSTKEESLAHAQQVAEDWYFELRGKSRAGLLKTEKTFADAARQFAKEYGIITEGQRSPRWVEGHQIRLRPPLAAVLRRTRPFGGHRRQGAGIPRPPGNHSARGQPPSPRKVPGRQAACLQGALA
jgi:hypothetical protein